MMKSLKVIQKQCVGCEICGIICSVTHGDQPRSSAMRIRIKRRYPDLPTPAFQPIVCQHCDKAKCVDACPKEALVPDESREQVMLIEARCDGCGKCVDACPFHAVWVDPIQNIAIKCDLCGRNPRCVRFCSFGAIFSPFEL